MDLNPPQLDAVATLSGPLLVLAGAGTGKTRVVTFRIANLIRHRVRPERILAVTFTNKAAGEMQERVTSLLGKKRKEKPEVSTFHSLCVRILRRNITHLGYPASFAIYDRGDQESVARAALREIRVPEAVLRPGDLINLISRWKTASIRPEEAATLAQTDKEHLGSIAYRRYQKTLKASGAVDFDDLLLCTEQLFQEFPEARQQEARRFDHLLIDEYQDTNGSQYRIVKALADEHRNLCVVGDDDQSIYGWRGAEVTHILNFKRDWPEAKVVRLETNYRSTYEIISWANRLIAFNKVRHDKTLQATFCGEAPRILQFDSEETEAKTVVEEISSRIHANIRQPRELAILFRTNEQPRAFEMELRRAKLPYVLVGGTSFYDRKEVRDILSYLKVLANPLDEVSILRVINTPPRGIGQATVTRLLENAVRQGTPIWETLPEAKKLANIPAPAVAGVAKFRALVNRYREQLDHQSPVDVARALIHEIGYKEELARLYTEQEEQDARWGAVEEVINALASYCDRSPEPSMVGFLHDVALTTPDDDREKENMLAKNAIVLMTLHAAKGLEFAEVYMVGMEEGLLPHRRSVEGDESAIDEERRLCYVGVTRAQKRLTLTMALSRRKWGKPRPTIASRFLYELTGQANNPNYKAAIKQQRPKATKATKPLKTTKTAKSRRK
ncbi:MAG: UvrD-helicase domain-containing protein [Thermoguttaceae bacterium]|jgi:DNA helicase-2/ATP-dependent DNA helicase PcrA